MSNDFADYEYTDYEDTPTRMPPGTKLGLILLGFGLATALGIGLVAVAIPRRQTSEVEAAAKVPHQSRAKETRAVVPTGDKRQEHSRAKETKKQSVYVPDLSRSDASGKNNEDDRVSAMMDDVPQQSEKQRQSNAAVEAIASHPWWATKISSEKAERLLAKIASLRYYESLIINKNFSGYVLKSNPWEVDDSPLNPHFGRLEGGGQNVCPVIYSIRDREGSLQMTKTKLCLSLRELLDNAYASEEKFRRTGKGDSTLDNLLQMEWPTPP